ncbi:MAG: hypothetical protein WC641_06855 [Patescibacteria group bacterium]
MFDNTPPNLPVEPISPLPSAPVAPPFVPSAPAAAPAPEPTPKTGGKEPEDIFAGLESANINVPQMSPPSGGEKKRLPWTIYAIIGGVILLVGISLGAWYLLRGTPTEETANLPETTAPQNNVEQPPVVETAPSTPTETATTVAPNSNIPPPTSEAPTPTPAPQILPGTDTDGDGLTDAAEAILGTNPTLKDSDGDGFPDGSELASLFDPAAAKASLESSAKMSKTNWSGWNFLMPTGWQLTPDAINFKLAVIKTGTPAEIRLSERTLPAGQYLGGWLGRDSGYTSGKNKIGYEMWRSADGLTTYLDADGTILVLSYEANTATTYEFREIFAALANSVQHTK